jgi:hypothetical protein
LIARRCADCAIFCWWAQRVCRFARETEGRLFRIVQSRNGNAQHAIRAGETRGTMASGLAWGWAQQMHGDGCEVGVQWVGGSKGNARRALAKKLGIELPPIGAELMRIKAQDLRAQGLSIPQIAKQLNRSQSRIYRHLRRGGVSPPSPPVSSLSQQTAG